jgi:ferredoxin
MDHTCGGTGPCQPPTPGDFVGNDIGKAAQNGESTGAEALRCLEEAAKPVHG